MAINLITQPGATTPIGNDDYTQQNLLLNGALAQGDEVLTGWADTVTEPSIAQGTYFYHSGNLYQVDSADEAISGTIALGVNYIVLSVSGTTLTASYTTDISSYAFNPAYNGLYNGTDLVIKAVTYLIGTAYHRALGADKAQNGMFILADGDLTTQAITATTGSFTGDVSLSGTISPLKPKISTVGSYFLTVPASGSLIIPEGFYFFTEPSDEVFGERLDLEVYINGLWRESLQGGTPGGTDYAFLGGLVTSDGVNFRFRNYKTQSSNVFYLKM